MKYVKSKKVIYLPYMPSVLACNKNCLRIKLNNFYFTSSSLISELLLYL